MTFKKAELQAFDAGTYTAAVRIAGGYKVYLETVNVARNLPAVEMVGGRSVIVAFFDEFNARDAVIIAVYAA